MHIFFNFLFIYSFAFLSVFTEEQSIYWIYFELYSRPIIWLAIFFGIVLSLLPDICLKVIENILIFTKIEKLKTKEADRVKKFNKELEEDFNYSFRPLNVYYLSHPDNKDVQTKVYRGKLNYDDGTIDIETKTDKPNERIMSFVFNNNRKTERKLSRRTSIISSIINLNREKSHVSTTRDENE